MKKVVISLLVTFPLMLFASPFDSNHCQVRAVLEDLNKFWKSKEINWNIADYHHSLKTDKEKIKLHLELVVDELRAKRVNHLNKTQKQNRERLLAVLEDYKCNGRFPLNIYHLERTPYFIDDFGTACAVGHLIIESNNRPLAESISSKYNYSYLEEMNEPKLKTWASEHGFTVEELKWIQPSYGPICPPGTASNPICHDGVGCINPDYAADGLIPPYELLVEFNNGNGWVEDTLNQLFFWGARIGQHRITVKDSIDVIKVYNYTISNIPEIQINSVVTNQTGKACNGQISVSVVNGASPYQINLMRQNPSGFWSDSSGHFTGLCEGDYTIVVYDNNYCQETKPIKVDNLTSLKENNEVNIKLYPIPFQDVINIDGMNSRNTYYSIFNITGKLEKEGTLNHDLKINTNDLESGTYFLKIRKANKYYTKKIMKL